MKRLGELMKAVGEALCDPANADKVPDLDETRVAREVKKLAGQLGVSINAADYADTVRTDEYNRDAVSAAARKGFGGASAPEKPAAEKPAPKGPPPGAGT